MTDTAHSDATARTLTPPIEIPPGGGTDTHVFALALSGAEAQAFATPAPGANGTGWPLKAALGADLLDPAHVEHFAAADLAGIGLTGYLTEGMGLDAAAVADARPALDAAKGDIVVLRPQAFGGQAQQLAPRAPLSLLGSFPAQQGATTMERLHTPSAEGQVLSNTAPMPAPTPRALKWLAAFAAFVFAVGLLILLTGGFT